MNFMKNTVITSYSIHYTKLYEGKQMKQNNNFELDVRVTPIKNGGNVKAYASVNIGSSYNFV